MSMVEGSQEAGVTPGFKHCSNPECPCSNPQPHHAFSKRAASKDGLQNRCKTCAKITMADREEKGGQLRGAAGSYKSCSNRQCSQPNPQPIGNFGPNSYGKDGYKSRCNSCRKDYYTANKDEILLNQRNYNERNKPRISVRKKAYRRRHLERITQKDKVYYEQNKERINEQARRDYYENHAERRRQQNEYRARNIEVVRGRDRYYRQANRDIIRLKSRAWYERNKERRLKLSRLWRQKNKQQCKILSNRYRVRKLNAAGAFNDQHLKWKLELQGGLCYYCGEELGRFHVDHKIPLSKGGTEWPANICAACPRCNLEKNCRDFWEFLAQRR